VATPIGAYETWNMMKNNHLNQYEAILMYLVPIMRSPTVLSSWQQRYQNDCLRSTRKIDKKHSSKDGPVELYDRIVLP
jgi:hypothetical protein